VGPTKYLPDKTTKFESEKPHRIIVHRLIKLCSTEADKQMPGEMEQDGGRNVREGKEGKRKAVKGKIAGRWRCNKNKLFITMQCSAASPCIRQGLVGSLAIIDS
jgi:hypothetical protein